MKKITTTVEVLEVKTKHKTGLQVLLRFVKTTTKRFLWFKPKVMVETRVERFTNYHDRKNNFFFHTCNCPDVSSGMHPDSWDYWLHRLDSTQYPFYPISRNEIRNLVDKWWSDQGIVATGSWPD